jgi:hypothetical protein
MKDFVSDRVCPGEATAGRAYAQPASPTNAAPVRTTASVIYRLCFKGMYLQGEAGSFGTGELVSASAGLPRPDRSSGGAAAEGRLVGIVLADVGTIRGYPNYGFLPGPPPEPAHRKKIPVIGLSRRQQVYGVNIRTP